MILPVSTKSWQPQCAPKALLDLLEMVTGSRDSRSLGGLVAESGAGAKCITPRTFSRATRVTTRSTRAATH